MSFHFSKQRCFPESGEVRRGGTALRSGARSSTCLLVGMRYLWAVIAVSVLSEGARGEAFSNYHRIGTFTLPAGAAMFDALPDGRLITLSGSTVYIETQPASGSFASVGDLIGADFPSFGAAFLRVSPDGARFAVGNNGGSTFSNYQIGVFNVSDLVGNWFNAAHYDAAWADNLRLAITTGEFGSPALVTVLDALSPNPLDPDNRIVIDGIGGSSGGLVLDGQGNLFTGNGFTGSGPSGTGAIKAFSNALWEAAYAGGTPIDFESQGTLVVDILSASPLDFDDEGNLLVGGGDFSQSGQTGYVALIRATAIAATLAGGGAANISDPEQVRRLDPDVANDFEFYATVSNAALSRVYVRDFGDTPVHVYLDTTGIPAASTWGVIDLGLLIGIAGSIALRSRAKGGMG